MSDLTLDMPARAATATRPAARPTADRSTRSQVFATALSLALAVCLTVPSSEIRAKAFRLGLIAKSAKTRASI